MVGKGGERLRERQGGGGGVERIDGRKKKLGSLFLLFGFKRPFLNGV